MPAVIGQPAPDFSLRDQQNNTVSLADLRGHKALIVFIPFPFTGICDSEACAIRDDLGTLEGLGAKVVIITTHAGPTNRRWAAENKLNLSVLADYWPHGAVAQQYGAFNEAIGVPMRESFVLDQNGVVRAVVKSDQLSQAREHEAYVRALSAI